MGKDGKKSSGVDNTFRRTWDKDEFREKAEEREKKVCLPIVLCLQRAIDSVEPELLPVLVAGGEGRGISSGSQEKKAAG